MTLKLGMLHRVLRYYQVCSNDDPGLTLTYFTARSNLFPYAFVLEKGKIMDFSETLVVYDLKLATDDRSDEKFLLASNHCSLGAVCPLPRGFIHILNLEKKNRIQSDFKEISLKLATNGKSDNAFLLTSKFCPLGGCLPLLRGYIIKKLYKIRLQRHFFFKLATNEWSDKTFLLALKLCTLGAVCTCHGAIYMYKIMIFFFMYKTRL